MLSNNSRVYPTIVFNIHGPATTNVPAMPFDFVDFDVRIAEKPRKFYRVRQP